MTICAWRMSYHTHVGILQLSWSVWRKGGRKMGDRFVRRIRKVLEIWKDKYERENRVNTKKENGKKLKKESEARERETIMSCCVFCKGKVFGGKWVMWE